MHRVNFRDCHLFVICRGSYTIKCLNTLEATLSIQSLIKLLTLFALMVSYADKKKIVDHVANKSSTIAII